MEIKMKKLYKLTFLLIALAWATNLMATDYSISGGGSSEINGTYSPDGTNVLGYPKWKKAESPFYIHSDGFKWFINSYGGM
jgi:hypothetical protein